MKTMIKIKTVLCFIAAVLLFYGCSDFLDRNPQGVESEDFFFLTEDQAIRATNAIYDVLGWQASQEECSWMLGDIVSDDALKGGENIADVGELQNLKEFNANASNSLLGPWFNEPYKGIYRANLVIMKVPFMDDEAIDSTIKVRLVGEAKFLRAFFYFKLIRCFGGVPLVTHPLSPNEYLQPRSLLDSCWAQIERDLKDAAAALPEKSEFDASEMGRATKGAANALLVKAYIYQKKWSDAETLAQTVISSGEYDLEPDYNDIFTLDHENGIESIFEIQHVTVTTEDWGDENEGQITTIFQGGRGYEYFEGWGFNCPDSSLYAEFETGDIRREASIIRDGDTLYKGTDAEFVADNSSSPTDMYARKYLLEYAGDAVPDMSNAPANWREIRYADLLLFHAEAAFWNGNVAGALVSLNKVRVRAKLPPLTAIDSLGVIYHERRVELALEGHRYFDVIRTGRGVALLGPNGYVDTKQYLPIPQQEMDLNPLLTQNPY